MIEESSYITGTVGQNQSFGIIVELEEDDEPLDTMRLKFWQQGQWVSELDIDFNAVDIALIPNTHDSFVTIGMDGELGWITNAYTKPILRQDTVTNNPLSARTCIIPYQNTLICTGMGRDTYQFNGSNWDILGSNSPPDIKGELVGFEALHAVNKHILYTAGWKGEIWEINQNNWAKIDSPTNLILTGITSNGSDEIYICGKNGIILKGKNDRFDVIDISGTSEDFWSIIHFANRIFIATLYVLYELIDDELIAVDDTEDAFTFCKLSANDSMMLSVGSASIITFDGTSWKSID